VSTSGRRGRDRMVVDLQLLMQSVPITTKIVSSIPVQARCTRYKFDSRSGEVYSIQHYVIKFVSDLGQVSDFLQAPEFPPPIKLTAII
jgi:hypothetical protein